MLPSRIEPLQARLKINAKEEEAQERAKRIPKI
jgi:hypothetical protein